MEKVNEVIEDDSYLESDRLKTLVKELHTSIKNNDLMREVNHYYNVNEVSLIERNYQK